MWEEKKNDLEIRPSAELTSDYEQNQKQPHSHRDNLSRVSEGIRPRFSLQSVQTRDEMIAPWEFYGELRGRTSPVLGKGRD